MKTNPVFSNYPESWKSLKDCHLSVTPRSKGEVRCLFVLAGVTYYAYRLSWWFNLYPEYEYLCCYMNWSLLFIFLMCLYRQYEYMQARSALGLPESYRSSMFLFCLARTISAYFVIRSVSSYDTSQSQAIFTKYFPKLFSRFNPLQAYSVIAMLIIEWWLQIEMLYEITSSVKQTTPKCVAVFQNYLSILLLDVESHYPVKFTTETTDYTPTFSKIIELYAKQCFDLFRYYPNEPVWIPMAKLMAYQSQFRQLECTPPEFQEMMNNVNAVFKTDSRQLGLLILQYRYEMRAIDNKELNRRMALLYAKPKRHLKAEFMKNY